MPVRFGECVFDGQSRQLVRSGVARPLTPKAFRLLQLLIDARPRALSRQELHDQLWPNVHVSHTSLARVVNEVRVAIGDDPRAERFLRTVHGFGYAFAEEAVLAALSGLSLLWSGHLVPLPEGESLIGRGPGCVVRVPSTRVSRHHARIHVHTGQAVLEDLGSKNGTFVGTRRIQRPTVLSDGDQIEIGPAVLTFCGPAGSQSTETGTGSR